MLLFFYVTSSKVSNAQIVRVDTLSLDLSNNMGVEIETAHFPVAKTSHPKIDSIINKDLKIGLLMMNI